MKSSNFAVGIICDKNKDEDFSCSKVNCVCYNGFDGSIWEGEKQKFVKLKTKDGIKIKIVVNLNSG